MPVFLTISPQSRYWYSSALNLPIPPPYLICSSSYYTSFQSSSSKHTDFLPLQHALLIIALVCLHLIVLLNRNTLSLEPLIIFLSMVPPQKGLPSFILFFGFFQCLPQPEIQYGLDILYPKCLRPEVFPILNYLHTHGLLEGKSKSKHKFHLFHTHLIHTA